MEPLNPKDTSTKALLAYNTLLKNDTRIETIILPVRDGLTVSRKYNNLVKKDILLTLLILVKISSNAQDIENSNSINNELNSNHSEMVIEYKRNKNSFNPALFINDFHYKNQNVLNGINPDIIESVSVERHFELSEKLYYGKIDIKTKSTVEYDFIALKDFTKKYLNLDNNPTVYQLDNMVLENDNLVIEKNYILSVKISKINFQKNYQFGKINYQV